MLDLSIELIEWLCEPLAYVLLVAMCFSAIRLFAKILFKRSVFQKCSLFLWQFVFLMVLAIFIVSPWYWLWLCLYKNALFKVLSWLKIPYERVPWIKRIADKEFPTALVVIRKIIDCFLILGCFPFSVLVLAVIKYYKLADDFWLFNIKFNKGRKMAQLRRKLLNGRKRQERMARSSGEIRIRPLTECQ